MRDLGGWNDSAESSAEDVDREYSDSGADEAVSDEEETIVFVAFLGFPAVEVDAVRLADANESVDCFSADDFVLFAGAITSSTRLLVI